MLDFRECSLLTIAAVEGVLLVGLPVLRVDHIFLQSFENVCIAVKPLNFFLHDDVDNFCRCPILTLYLGPSSKVLNRG